MINTRGIFNIRHRQWNFPGGKLKPCIKCSKIDAADAELELILRQCLCNKLQIENDSFEKLFEIYPGLIFHLSNQPYPSKKNYFTKNNETQLVKYFLDHKLVLGVGIQHLEWDHDERLAEYAKYHFAIPVMKCSQMWQMLVEDPTQPIDFKKWKHWQTNYPSERSPFSFNCLICENFPFDVYPGNFIVNESVCSIKSIIWPDRRRPHFNKKAKAVIIYDNSRVEKWPFLSSSIYTHIHNEPINHLGNMAIFTTGEIFISRFLHLVIRKVDATLVHNRVVKILKDLQHPLSLEDFNFLKEYYHMKKSETNKINLKILQNYTYNNNMKVIGENDIRLKLSGPSVSMISINPLKIKATAIRCGHIDESITQTKILGNSTNINMEDGKNNNSNSNNSNTTTNNTGNSSYNSNNDWNKIGRFSRNYSSNSYANICLVACGLQKLLPKDSKAKEPKSITLSEVGFIDLLNTPDTPQRCGILLEMIPDVIVATTSMCHSQPEQLLLTLFPQLQLVENPSQLEKLDNHFVYIIIHNKLFYFPLSLFEQDSVSLYFRPHLSLAQWEYVCLFGGDNLFRFVQYILKLHIPCIELLEYTKNQLWMCTSLPRISYKILPNGQLYTSKELDTFHLEKSQYFYLPTQLLPPIFRVAEKNEIKYDYEFLYIGYERENIPNLMGPTARVINRPNAVHLPRVSNSLQSFRHYAGISVNTHSVGEIHQKNAIHTLYTTSRTSKLLPIPCQNPMVAVVNWHNPEDSITVKQDSIDRGLFTGVSYETFIVRYNYGPLQNIPPCFRQTYFDQHVPLRRGVQLGILIGVSSKCQEDNSLINFTCGEIEFVRIDVNTLALIWNGKMGDLKDPIYDDSIPLSVGTKRGGGSRTDYRVTVADPCFPSLERQRRLKKSQYSLAFNEHHPNYHTYRYFKMDNVDLPALQSWRFSLMTATSLIPSMGDKLQTPTSQKGIIGRLVSEQDMPFINLNQSQKSSSLPIDVLINTHSIKRQAMDLYCNNHANNNYMDSAFTLTLENVTEHLQWGKETCTGILINPYTGQPYLNREKEPMLASLYEGTYMCVTNHRASATMHTSRAGEVIVSDLTGAPVRGRRGGLSTGPMELVSFRSIGATRIHTELTQIRSDLTLIELERINREESEREGENTNVHRGIICGSKYLQRHHDDLNLAGINLAYRCRSRLEVQEIKDY